MNMKSGLPMEVYRPQTELDCMEIVVGALTGAWKNPERAGNVRQVLQTIFDAYEKALPPYLSDDFAFKVFEKLRKLLGEWNSLKFGESLKLEWVAL